MHGQRSHPWRGMFRVCTRWVVHPSESDPIGLGRNNVDHSSPCHRIVQIHVLLDLAFLGATYQQGMFDTQRLAGVAQKSPHPRLTIPDIPDARCP